MNDEINEFVNSYRESLDRQKDLGMQNLDNNRQLAHQQIMGGANALGMMYSNFPERQKIQYDTGTYEPAKIKLQETYQTGLDTLRKNTANYINQLSEINEAITDLNEASATPVWEQDDIDYAKYNVMAPERNADKTGYNYYDAAGNPIKFATFAKRLGATTNEDIVNVAGKYDPVLAQNLYRIYSAQQNTSHPNFTWNTGANYKPVTYKWLSESDRGLLNSAGLAF